MFALYIYTWDLFQYFRYVYEVRPWYKIIDIVVEEAIVVVEAMDTVCCPIHLNLEMVDITCILTTGAR